MFATLSQFMIAILSFSIITNTSWLTDCGWQSYDQISDNSELCSVSQTIYNNYSETITRTMAWLQLTECQRDRNPSTKGNNTVFYSYNKILSLSQEDSMVNT